MKNIKKILLIIVNCTLAICVGILFAGCNNSGSKNKDNEQQKYDVVMKVVCQEIDAQGYPAGNTFNEVIFTLGKDEISLEHTYRGKKCRYYVYQYNMPNHPNLGEKWLQPYNSGGEQRFTTYLIYKGKGVNEDNVTTDEQNEIKDKTISEPGEYVYIFETFLESTWNHRSCKLYVNVN